eukprot:5322627-Lingulodinium_polyedra.AAC.1
MPNGLGLAEGGRSVPNVPAESGGAASQGPGQTHSQEAQALGREMARAARQPGTDHRSPGESAET